MRKNWVITSAAERIVLDGQKRGEASFTVTNASDTSDAMFEVVPLEGAQPAWFAVDSPQRTVATNASVNYIVKVTIPPTTPGGTYAVKGRVYSAESTSDLAPEETSVDSGRVVLEVPKPEAPPPKKPFPWWIIVVAALVAVVLAVVIGLVIGRLIDNGGGNGPVVAPDLTGQTLEDAERTVTGAGLRVGTVTRKHDRSTHGVVAQSVRAGTSVARDSIVDFTVAVTLTAPVLLKPVNGEFVTGAVVTVEFTWQQAENYVTRWQILVTQERCTFTAQLECTYLPINGPSTVSAQRVPVRFNLQFRYVFPFNSGNVRWQVTPLDDLGRPGPTALYTFQIRP